MFWEILVILEVSCFFAHSSGFKGIWSFKRFQGYFVDLRDFEVFLVTLRFLGYFIILVILEVFWSFLRF